MEREFKLNTAQNSKAGTTGLPFYQIPWPIKHI